LSKSNKSTIVKKKQHEQRSITLLVHDLPSLQFRTTIECDAGVAMKLPNIMVSLSSSLPASSSRTTSKCFPRTPCLVFDVVCWGPVSRVSMTVGYDSINLDTAQFHQVVNG
jgi:hypothetical protein